MQNQEQNKTGPAAPEERSGLQETSSTGQGSHRLVVVAAALLVLLMGSNIPTPLYLVYEKQFHFTNQMLTLIFAIYALVMIPALLLFGQFSDGIGRKPVILGGLALAAVGLVLFAAARNTAWLFAARVVQGLAVGATTGTAIAALVEVEPNNDRRRAAMAAVIGLAGGCAAGPLLSGLLTQWGPAPGLLCYVAGLAATASAAAAVWRIEEPGKASGAWRVQKPFVPGPARARFMRASLTSAAAWSVGALFLSVVPSYTALLLDTNNLALLGAVSAVMLLSSCISQAWSLRAGLAPNLAQPMGLALLVIGLASVVSAFPLHSLALVLCSGVLSGAGLGFGSFGAQAEINELAPDERRGEVTAAFLTCVYAGVALAAISVGLLSKAFSLFAAVGIVGTGVAVVALAAAAWHLSANRSLCGRVLCVQRS